MHQVLQSSRLFLLRDPALTGCWAMTYQVR